MITNKSKSVWDSFHDGILTKDYLERAQYYEQRGNTSSWYSPEIQQPNPAEDSVPSKGAIQ